MLGHLGVRAQALQVVGRQLQTVLAGEIQNGFQADIAVQVAMKVNQWDIFINHDAPFIVYGKGILFNLAENQPD